MSVGHEMMKPILIILLLVSLWVGACAGLNYARSTANAAWIVSAVSRYRTPENAEAIQELEGEVALKLNSIRKPYVSLAYGGGMAAVLCIAGLIVNRKKRMSNQQVHGTQ